nr:hypothetical protein PJ912_20410 [Pectobacterium colocasium]
MDGPASAGDKQGRESLPVNSVWKKYCDNTRQPIAAACCVRCR